MGVKLMIGFCFSCTFLVGLSVSSTDEDEFSKFIDRYAKEYKPGSVEYEARFANFKRSLERHRKLNSFSQSEHDAVYGITKFSDLSEEEFARTVLGHSRRGGSNSTRSGSSHLASFADLGAVPKSYDLRKNDWTVLTAVKNQKECGGCWAFSITENLETQYALKYKKLYKLSVQELIDCTKGGSGCHGGNICGTAEWLYGTGLKVTTAENYPFTDKTGVCKISDHGKVSITNYTCDGFVKRESQMVSRLYNHGPLTVAVDATSWQDYLGGIIQHHCAGGDNHAVQIVGYNQKGPVPYYIVRNSWGKDWGANGYLRIKIGGNLCGIAEEVVTVSV